MSADNNVTRTLVMGNTGCGKSRLSKQLLKNADRLIFIDPQQEWGEECQAVSTYDELFELMRQPKFRIAVWIEDDDVVEMVDIIIRACRAPEVGNCVLAIDELYLYFDPRKDPSREVSALVRFARRQGVHFWGISQRYVDTPLIVRSQSTHLYAFRSHEEVDIERMKAMVGSKEQAEMVRSLPDGEYLYWDLRTRELKERGRVLEFQQRNGDGPDFISGSRDRESNRRAEEHPESNRLTTDDSSEEEEESE